MHLKLVSPSIVSSDTGLHLIPAGLFKYAVVSDPQQKQITFWTEFGDQSTPHPSVTVSFSTPPLWDDGTSISRGYFGEIAEVIGDGFALKGFQAIFTVLKDTSQDSDAYATIHQVVPAESRPNPAQGPSSGKQLKH